MQAYVRIFKFKFILLCKWQVIECAKVGGCLESRSELSSQVSCRPKN
jgi:hypothetical protein